MLMFNSMLAAFPCLVDVSLHMRMDLFEFFYSTSLGFHWTETHLGQLEDIQVQLIIEKAT